MPLKLTTVNKIKYVSNSINSTIINDFYLYMKSNGCSEHHQNNNLKVAIASANFLGTDVTFYDINKREQITAFLDTKIKTPDQDPDKRWITTWNHYLHRIKLLFRWLYNQRGKQLDDQTLQCDWKIPALPRLKEGKSNALALILKAIFGNVMRFFS